MLTAYSFLSQFFRFVSSYLPVHPAAPPCELTFRWRMEALVHVYADGVKEARMRYNQSRYIALHGVLVILYFKIRTDERLTLTEQKCHSSNGHGQGIVHSSCMRY